MAAFDLLQRWLAPLLTPLNDVRQTLNQPTTIHADAVNSFSDNVNKLLDGPNAYSGDGAKAMQDLAQNYLNSEAQFTGAGTNLTSRTAQAVLDPAPAPIGSTALEEVAQASETCATQLTEATVTAGSELAGETGLDTVTEVVDVAAVAQAGLDPVTDIPAGVLTAISAGLKIAALVALGWSIFQAVQQWLTTMNRLGHFVLLPLPSFINPWGTPSPTFLGQGLTEQQQLQLADLLQKYPGVSQSDLENLLKLGYDEKTIELIIAGIIRHFTVLPEQHQLQNTNRIQFIDTQLVAIIVAINTNRAYFITAIQRHKSDLPYGFASEQIFRTFGKTLYNGLASDGYTDAQAGIQGSAVTGVKYTTGWPFDANRQSDFDIAIASPILFAKAKELGVKLRSGGTRTGPLRLQDLQRLGLLQLSEQLYEMMGGRDIAFMIYDSSGTMSIKAPTIIIPGNK